MARKTASRLQKRRELEAAESQGATKTKAKRKKAKRKTTTTTRRKAKAVERKRLVWGIFSGSLKEEARFPYDERDAAEEKLAALRARGKKSYFIQPIKEIITDPLPVDEEAEGDEK